MDWLKSQFRSENTINSNGNIWQKIKKHPLRRAFFIFFAAFIFLGMVFFTKANNFFSVINKNIGKDDLAAIFPIDEKVDLYKNNDRTNFLILGVRGEGDSEHGGLLTDTIIVVSVDSKKKQAALISLPRDIYLRIPSTQKKEKINAAYLIGEEKLPGGGGLELSKRAVEYVAGLFIDHVISVDFEAFKEIMDEFGGVDIYLEKEFSENKQWGTNFYIPAGQQHLDGETALYYTRSRFSSNDFDRARRQQQVLMAIKDKATQLGFLTNPFKINSMLEILKNRVKTDITIFDIIKYSRLMQEIEDNDIKYKVFSTEDGTLIQTYIDGAYVLLPASGNFGEIREISKNIFN